MLRRTRRSAPTTAIVRLALVLILPGLLLTIIACEDLSNDTPLADSPALVEVATATTIQASNTQATETEEPTPRSTTTYEPGTPKDGADIEAVPPGTVRLP
jgi:hypothetical protein